MCLTSRTTVIARKRYKPEKIVATAGLAGPEQSGRNPPRCFTLRNVAKLNDRLTLHFLDSLHFLANHSQLPGRSLCDQCSGIMSESRETIPRSSLSTP